MHYKYIIINDLILFTGVFFKIITSFYFNFICINAFLNAYLSHVLMLTGGGRKCLRYCGIGLFLVRCTCCGNFFSKYGIAVFRVQAVCSEFKFYVTVVGEKNVVSR